MIHSRCDLDETIVRSAIASTGDHWEPWTGGVTGDYSQESVVLCAMFCCIGGELWLMIDVIVMFSMIVHEFDEGLIMIDDDNTCKAIVL